MNRGSAIIGLGDKKLLALLSQSTEAVTVLGLDGCIISSFRGSGGTWGTSAEGMPGVDGRAFVHPEDLDCLIALVAEVVEDPTKSLSFEARIIRIGDSWRWAEGTISNMIDDPEVDGIVFTFRDCHDRKELELRASASELSFQSLVQNSADAMVGVNSDQRLIVWNLAAEAMFGYSKDEIAGQPLSVLLPEDERDYHDQFVEGFAAESVERRTMNIGHKTEAIRRNGVRFPVEVGLAKVPFNDGVLLLASVRDVTVRRLVEASAEQAHGELHAIMSAIPDSICRLDSDGIILDVMAGRVGSGLPLPDDSVGKCILDVLPPEIAPVCQNGIDEALAKGVITQMEFDVAVADTDDVRSFETRHVPLGSGEVLAVVRDVTERVAADEQARRASDRFQTLAETSFESLVVVDEDGQIIYLGGPSVTSLGVSADLFPGESIMLIINAAHRDDRDRVLAEYERISREPGVRSIIQARFAHADGSWRWLEVSSRNLFYDETINGLVINVRDITSEKAATSELRVSGDRFRFLAESSHEGLIVFDRSGNIVYFGGPPIGVLGNVTATQVGLHFVDLISAVDPDYESLIEDTYERVMAVPKSDVTIEARFRHADGSWAWLEIVFRNLFDEPAVSGLVVNVRNVTARKTIEFELQIASDRSRFLSESSLDGVVLIGADHKITYRGGPSISALGQATKDILGVSIYSLIDRVHPDDKQQVTDEHERVMTEPRSNGSVEARFRHIDGSWRWLSLTMANLFHEEAVGGLLANIRDVTAQKEAEAELEHQALHDSLTSLPNRALLLDRLEHALARTGRRGGLVGLLFLDLDRFKNINDTLGHNAGDQLLVGVAERLCKVVRDSDTLARLGGDEFVVLGEDVSSTEELFTLAERMLDSLGSAVRIGDREFFTTASIGIAVALDGDHDASTLMRNADAAMYRAKQDGRNRIEAFDQALQVRLEHRISTETALRGAVQRSELQMHYQPIVNISTSEIVGVEALIRWHHPTRGLVLPDEFIPIAEETDLIRTIGEWVAMQTCMQVTEWERRLGVELDLAINISARQLVSANLPETIAEVLSASGLEPTKLCLEITETALIDQPDIAVANLLTIRNMGVEVALDDFGTGYASLAYLRTLPITQIKVDRSFTSGLMTRPSDKVIVESTIALAHGLGLVVVGEGVETQAQMDVLRDLGCDFAQGYFLGRPESPEIFELGLSSAVGSSD